MNHQRQSKPHILVSALACHRDLGSEATVGYRYVEFLAERYKVTALASRPNLAPPGVHLVHCNAGPCQLNDVDALALMRFELNQLRLVSTGRVGRVDIVHRITPAAITIPTLVSLLGRPLVLGPLIAASAPPQSFEPILRLPPRSRLGYRLQPKRVVASAARRASDYLRRSELVLSNAVLILVGTEEARRQVPESVKTRCVPITWCGIEHEFFVPPEYRPEGRPLQLLFVGRLVPYKGVELLLRAVHGARQRCNLQVRIVGDDDLEHARFLKRLAIDLGLTDIVRFERAVSRSELRSYYRDADVFCFPTLADTYGMSLLEAMSAGCAVVASRTGGPGELVKADTGITIPLTNPERYSDEFAGALVALAHNSGFRRRLGESARRYVVQEHDWSRIGARLLQIYDGFLADFATEASA